MPKEIEVKIELESGMLERLRNWLIQNAKFMDRLEMVDYYLDNPQKSMYVKSPKGFIDPIEFWRVRQVDNVYFLCNKKRAIDQDGKTLYVEENEAVTPDGQAILQVLKKRGLTNQVIIRKTRELFQIQDFEVALDDIQDLGKFVEIELKSDEQDVEVGIEKIYGLLKKIGIAEFIQYDRGYLCMSLNPKIDFGEHVKL